MTQSLRIFLTCAAAMVLMAVAWVYFTLDPSTTPIFPHCVFLEITGLKCPGCGSQRAIHALLHGNFSAAWHFNAMMFALLPLIILMLYAQLGRKKSGRLYRLLNSRLAIWLISAAIFLWWLTRNIFGW